MKNFSIAKRLVFLALMALTFLGSVSAVAIYQMNAAQKRFEIIQTSVIPSIQILNETSMQSAALRSAVRDFIIGGFLENEGLQQTQRLFIETLKEKIEANFSLYQEKYATTAENRALLEADRTAFKAYLAEVSDLFEKVDAKDTSGISQHFSEIGSFRRTALVLIKSMADHAVENQKYADRLRMEGVRDYEQGFNLLLGIGLLALVVMSGFSYLLIRGILHSLREIGGAIDSIEGKLDFTITAAVVGKDEIASVSEKLNRLVAKLRESLSTILENSLTISRSAEHLSRSSEEVAAASSHQSDAAAGMAASVEELTVSIAHVSDRSTEAHTLSVHSGEYSKSGETVINQTVEDISAIATSVKHASECIAQLEESSGEITMVTAVIKEVAEQTNLLALNAAIEAARAGDHGRGFSVVADEVRKLAERTATSTTQITMMVESMRTITREVSDAIDRAVALVSSGVSRANDANDSIRKINEASFQAVSMVEEITDAIREQSQASTSIAGAVEGIAQMAEESSASAQNTAESAKLLDEVAHRLESTVKQYKL